MCERKLFVKGLDRLRISLEDDSIDDILRYCRELQKWNKRINLIARKTSAAEIVEKHFLDSLTLLSVIDQYGEQGATLLDIGTGAGFPGLVLAAVRPELQVTLVEPRQKRVSFLRHIIRMLQLKNVRVIDKRLEQATELAGQKNDFTFITSRAVAAVDLFLPMIENVAGSETLVIMMQATDDRQQWADNEQSTRWQRVDNKTFTLPFSRHPRSLALIRKQR